MAVIENSKKMKNIHSDLIPGTRGWQLYLVAI